MAIKKSTYTGGAGRPMLHSPNVAHQPVTAIILHTFTEAVATSDILELAYLPADCKILAAELMSVNTAATTFDVGFMSGDVGSKDPARTVDAALFDNATPTTKVEASVLALAALTKSQSHRSIGVVPSANIAANTATKLALRLTYAKGGQ